jgi:hypothetical protein
MAKKPSKKLVLVLSSPASHPEALADQSEVLPIRPTKNGGFLTSKFEKEKAEWLPARALPFSCFGHRLYAAEGG